MPLTEQQKSALWGLGALGLFVAAAALRSSDDEDDEFDDDLDVDSLCPGRNLELMSLIGMDRKYGEDNVHDNPTLTASDGMKIRPDVVVADDEDVIEVREAKDVVELREIHVLQAARYDAELVPRKGTTLDIADDTVVPRDVRRLARSFDIAIKRVRLT
jgi:hypothetical protein